jgi:hypothetical protein
MEVGPPGLQHAPYPSDRRGIDRSRRHPGIGH